MSRRVRIIRNIAIGLAALIVVLVAAALIVVHTDRFQNYVREKIITALQEGTGGKTEIGSFNFDAAHLRARITNLVIHGSEPAGSAPFARVASIDLQARLFGGSGHLVGVSYLAIDRPEINVIVFPDGRTNLPTPKPSEPSKTTPLETVVDLAVSHFELRNGHLTYNSQPQPLDVNANNVHAQLWYHILQRDYQGQLTLEPIYVVAGRKTPVTLRVTLPVTLERDAIRLHDASIATPDSNIQIAGSMENLRQPKFAVQLRGKVTLADLKNAAGIPLETNRRDLPEALQLEANATEAAGAIDVTALKLVLGHSIVEAHGALQTQRGRESFKFDAHLVLGELARVARLNMRPQGTLALNGEAALDAGGRRLDLRNLRLAAFGGELDADASMEDFTRYQVNGTLRHLDVGEAMLALGQKPLPYDGVVSGPVHASGDLHAAGTAVDAGVKLAIVPGRRGIPIQGRLFADYSGATDDVRVQDSYLALPHSRVTLAGSLRSRLAFSLTTRDPRDLAPGASVPVTLNGGQAVLTGTVTGTIKVPHVTAHLAANHFQVEGRQFDTLAADLAASPSRAQVANGALTRGNMRTTFAGTVGLRDWTPTPNQPVSADANVQNGDLADIMAMAGQSDQDYYGSLTANLHVTGTVGSPTGAATIHAANGEVQGEPFDAIDAQVNLSDQLATIPSASLVSGAARVDLAAEFKHPRDSFSTGRIHAHVRSNRIDLAKLRTLDKQAPLSSGELQLNADVTGDLGGPDRFRVTNVNADASGRAIRFEGQPYNDFQLTARTSGQTATVDATSDFAGSNIRVHGKTQLVDTYPTTADVQVGNLAVERVLAVVHRTDIPARGILSATAHVRGTFDKPEGDATLDLAKAVVYDEPIDRAQARVTYLAQRVGLEQLDISSGPSRISLTAQFDHPVGSFDTGNLQFRVENSHLDLARLHTVQNARPGLGGTVQLSAGGAAKLQEKSPRLLVSTLNANVATNNLTGDGKKLGNFTLAAHTTSGDRLDFTLNSDLAGATLQASGNGRMGGDYPIDAQLSFNNVTWSRVQTLLGTSSGTTPTFEATAEGKATVTGPVLQTDQLRGALQVTRLEVRTKPQSGAGKSITLQNQGPITASLDRGKVTLTAFHFTGPQTDIQAGGSVAMQSQTLDLKVNAGLDLGVLQNFDRDITSSGNIKLAANVRGTVSDPVTDGSLELHNANFNYATLPNGLGNANGVVVFRGNRATVQNLTAESGGGKLTLGGYVAMSGNLRFALRANASKVRVRLQEGVSVMADADIRIAGTTASSTASGAVTLDQLNYSPHSDFGSMLERATPNVETATTPSPITDNMHLDVRVRTSPAMQVQSSLGENLQTDADLRVRGTASRPSVLGRVTLTSGQLVFFGSTYTVNTGSISFFNPTRIEPILNLSLETKTKGVDVVLNVTGPLDNMKLSYSSDPPLQFQEIAGLLFSGTTPTSDPTILANQPSPPPQSLGQRGESALLAQGVANPVAGRLHRVFGVSQLKIDPSFTGSSQLPTAQLTLQQQVTPALTFTYVSAIDNPNSTLIRADWALNQQWSAMAVRDQNGIFSINLLYKKQFR